jgi:4-amino-4-deoxy-L-arabinose transferase-like glycosyltransferase
MIYSILRVFRSEERRETRKYMIISGFLIGYIVLTKIAFGWVTLFMLGGSLILWLINRKSVNYRKGLIIMAIAFATILPYLAYTYSLTGRMFYWSTNSGGSLYWASSPFKDEYGDWKLELKQHGIDMGNYNTEGSTDSLVAHHQKEYDEIYKYNSIGQDDAYKKFAVKNIREHPVKYIQNCIYNVGRMFFHYPFSHAVQRPKTLLVFPINGILLTFILFCLIPTFRNWKKLSYPVRFMILFAGLYFAESTLVTALIRMFTVIVPIIILWMAYIFDKTVKINLRFREKAIGEDA